MLHCAPPALLAPPPTDQAVFANILIPHHASQVQPKGYDPTEARDESGRWTTTSINGFEVHVPPASAGRIAEPGLTYPPGTPEAAVLHAIQKAPLGPDGLPQMSGRRLENVFGAPSTTVIRGRPLAVALPSLADLRIAAGAGMPYKDWYVDMAQKAAHIVGPANMPEFAVIMGITSAKTTVQGNLSATFKVMAGVRRLNEQYHGDPDKIRASILDMGEHLPPPANAHTNPKDYWIRKPPLQFPGAMRSKREDIWEAYRDGISVVKGNAKEASYANTFISATQSLYDPNTTQDVWQARLFGVFTPAGHVDKRGELDITLNESHFANNDKAYRWAHAITVQLAHEQGIAPHQEQAALWYTINRLEGAAPVTYDKLRSGKITLGKAIAQAKIETPGIFDTPRGGPENFEHPSVKRDIEGAGDLTTPAPLKGQGMIKLYPGGDAKNPKVPRRAVDALEVEQGRVAAEREAPLVNLSVSHTALQHAGMDKNGHFPWLAMPHQVHESPDGTFLSLPGGNLETAYWAGAAFNQATGARSFQVRMPLPNAPTLGGLKLTMPASAKIERALDELDVPFARSRDGSYYMLPDVHQHGQAFVKSVQRVVSSVAPTATLDTFQGYTDRVYAKDYANILGAYSSRFLSAERSDLQRRALGELATATTRERTQLGPHHNGRVAKAWLTLDGVLIPHHEVKAADGHWVTLEGQHVFIAAGEKLDDVFNRLHDGEASAEWGTKAYAEWRSQLTERQKQEIRLYESSGYRGMNQALRSDDKAMLRARKERIRVMDAALQNAYTDKPLTVYRLVTNEGTDEDTGHDVNGFDLLKKMKVGDTVTDAAYVSTALDKTYLDKFGPGGYFSDVTPDTAGIVQIRVPKGTRAAYLGRDFLASMDEHELLIARGATFKLTSKSVDAKGVSHFAMELVRGPG